MNKIEKIHLNLNKFYIFLFFFVVPTKYNNYVTIGFLILSLIILGLRGSFRVKITTRIFVFYVIVLALVVNAFLLSPYSAINTVLSFLYLFICNVCYNKDLHMQKEKGKVGKTRDNHFDWFYWFVLGSIVIHLVLYIAKGDNLSRFFIDSGDVDTNTFATVIFIFYSYCFAKGYKFWIPVAIATVFFMRDSRQCLLMAFLFVVILVIKKITKRQKNKTLVIRPSSNYRVFQLLLLASIFTVLFSLFWVNVISNNFVVEYHESLNDNSNAVRFRANLYVLQAIKDNPELLFYGYDNSIRSVLGDTDVEFFTRYMGYRLVQSHNSVLNMLIKNGVIFTIFYYLLISRMFKDLFVRQYCEYWVPYLAGSMFLQDFFKTDYLLFFCILASTVFMKKAMENDNGKEQ